MKKKIDLTKLLDIASEISHTLGVVSRSPYTAALAVGLQVLKAGARIKDELSYSTGDTSAYFSSLSRLPGALDSFVFPHVTKSRLVMKTYYGSGVHPDAYEGYIGKMKIGWLQAKDASKSKRVIYVEKEDLERIFDQCREAVWAEQLSQHITITTDSILPHEVSVALDFKETEFVKSMLHRVKSFDHEPSRCYMLIGPPGCGKTCAIGYIVSKYAKRSINLDIGDLSRVSSYGDSGRNDVWGLTQLLKPSVIILNDFGRLADYQQADWLNRTEEMRKFAKMVLISVNDPAKLSKALQRVDRIDDHIVVPGLELSTIKSLLGADLESRAERMTTWPIAFIRDYRKRVQALGVEVADSELAELDKRVKETLANPGN